FRPYSGEWALRVRASTVGDRCHTHCARALRLPISRVPRPSDALLRPVDSLAEPSRSVTISFDQVQTHQAMPVIEQLPYRFLSPHLGRRVADDEDADSP